MDADVVLAFEEERRQTEESFAYVRKTLIAQDDVLDDIRTKVTKQGAQLTTLGGEMVQLNGRLTKLEGTVTLLDVRVGVLDTKVDALDVRVGVLDTKVDGIAVTLQEVLRRLPERN